MLNSATGGAAGGNHSGTIDVTTNGDLTVTGANTTDRYAIIGHGDEPTDGDSGQTVSGDVLLRVGGNATLMNAFVGHQIDSDGVYDNGNTFLGVVGDLTADADSQFNSAPNNSPDGELRIYLGGDDLVDTATLMNGTAHGPLPFPNDQGDHVFGNGPYAPTSGNFAYYHIQQGLYNYTVDAAEAAAIVAALNLGDVTLASDLDQSAFGSFYDWDGGTQFIDINSDVAYDANQSFTLLATGPVNFNASVQNRNETGGDLNIVGGWELGTAFDATTFTAADVTSTTLFGNNMGSVFIGDGSQADGVAVGSRSGNTNVFAYDVNLQGGTGSATLGRFAQLGFQILNGVAWGGYDLDPTSADGANVIVDGGITVHSINNVTATGGNTSDYNYVQIGHVGAEQIYDASVEAAADSLIELTVGGNLSFTGGSRYAAYAQLGQGGFGADGDQSGMITITRANNLSFTGGSGFAAYAQLGQGGYSASGNHNGTTTITQANDLNFAGGGADYAYAQLGQGGSFAQGNHSGITTITQADDLIFTGGGGFATYAQLGQGGTFGLGTLSGMTTITQAVDLIFTGGGGFAAYAQLGQGGADFTGDASGTLILSQADDLIFTGGSEDFTYAQLGQGGRYALGSHSGTTTIERANDLIFTGGTEFGATAQLGQGGYDADGSHSGTTTLTQANDLIFTGGAGDHTDAQLGQGGSFASGNHSGTTTITQANDLIFAGGSGFSASAQLGQGGYYAIGNHSGTTTITQANDLIFTGGTEFDASVQLGQGGYFAEGNHSGTTTITQANDLRFSGGSGAYTNVLFGQGGTDADGNHSGTTTIMQANDLIFAGGDGFRAYAQLGQGGAYADGNHGGTTTITQANDLTFTSGSGFAAYAQLGQGGFGNDGQHSGTLDATLTGNLTLTGQDLVDQYVLIGHGDEPGDGDAGHSVSGDINLRVGGNATLTKAFLGHQIDGDGTYTSGNTFLGVVGNLTADAASQFNSAPNNSPGGELRIYLEGDDLVDTATLLNGTAHGAAPFPNDQGSYFFGYGPYSPTTGNFAYYHLLGFYNFAPFSSLDSDAHDRFERYQLWANSLDWLLGDSDNAWQVFYELDDDRDEQAPEKTGGNSADLYGQPLGAAFPNSGSGAE